MRWRDRDHEKLRSTVKKFNAKIAYHAKKEGMQEYLPQKKSMKELRSLIGTRKDYDTLVKSMERFLVKGAEKPIKTEYGETLTEWARDEFYRNQKIENRRRAKRAKELGEKDVTIAGQSTGNKRSEMGSIKENATKELHRNVDKMKKGEFERIARLMEKRMLSTYDNERKILMLENYIKGLIKEGYSEKLQQLLLTVPLETFVDVVDTDELATFAFIYDPQELAIREEYLYDLWWEHSTGHKVTDINVKAIRAQVAEEMEEFY